MVRHSAPEKDTVPKRQNRERGRPGHDRSSVLRAAIELFNQRGYEATSIGDLAQYLGLTKSAIYHHVPSKQHLLKLALDDALDGLTQAVETARNASNASSAYQRLHATVHNAVLILVEHLPAVTLLLRVRGNTELETQALRRRREIDEVFATVVADAVREGSIRADLDPQIVSRMLFGTVNSLTQWYQPEGEVDATQLADTLTTLVFDGLRR